MTDAEWGRELGVAERTIARMGGAKQLDAMTALGRELLVAVWLRSPDDATVRVAVSRIGRENRDRRKRRRESKQLRWRREHLLRRMRGVTEDLVWLGHAGLKKPPMRRPAQCEQAVVRSQGWHPAVVWAMARQERKVG